MVLNVVGDLRFHRLSDSQGLMDSVEIVVSDAEHNVLVVVASSESASATRLRSAFRSVRDRAMPERN